MKDIEKITNNLIYNLKKFESCVPCIKINDYVIKNNEYNNINNNYSVQLLNGKAYFLILLSVDISSCFFNTLLAKKIPCDKWLNQLNFNHEEN